MPDHPPTVRRRAAQMLLVATVFWGVSFPVMKALGLLQEHLVPGASSWFVTSLAITVRFAAAALLLLPWTWRTLSAMTALEVWQGFGLGVFGGLGLIFQMDGLAYTSASTSAFLTQCYCVILPVIVAVRDRRRPSLVIVAGSIMVIAGVAVLADLDWRDVKLGRGEVETLIGSVLFTGQILWLERPVFARNRVEHFSLVMFVTMVLCALPLAVATTRRAADWQAFLSAPEVLGLVAILVVLCTMFAYLMMNYWQPFLPAAEAGLIYSAEPVFASLLALFLPVWLSNWTGVNYANEQLTLNLLLGGGLITAANVLVQLRSSKTAPEGEAPGLQGRAGQVSSPPPCELKD